MEEIMTQKGILDWGFDNGWSTLFRFGKLIKEIDDGTEISFYKKLYWAQWIMIPGYIIGGMVIMIIFSN